MNKPNLLIGAISANYSPTQISRWVETSNWDNCERVLLLYNETSDYELLTYLQKHNVIVLQPTFDFWGTTADKYLHDTGLCTLKSSYDLIHNIRFFHIWNYLCNESYEKVLITDVRDVYFNRNPFSQLQVDKLTATSEGILYKDHEWNYTHVSTNLGLIGLNTLSEKPVYNVGVFGGGAELIRNITADIYLLSIGKLKVADQTSFNYLIQTKYKTATIFSDIDDKFTIHLHVVNEGHVQFQYSDRRNYAIIHQYDRMPFWEI